MVARLKTKYRDEVAPQLLEEFKLGNVMRVPRLRKIVVNMGIGNARKDHFKALVEDLARITGQRPVVTRSTKSISNFKLRKGMNVGAKVTLRGERMYEFLDRLISASLPRIRDFRGVSARGFDGRGSYTLGIREQSIFPEIDPNHVAVAQGMDITFVTSARGDEEARGLLRRMGLPFAGK
jgi:large subunit ribosomal protein L5